MKPRLIGPMPKRKTDLAEYECPLCGTTFQAKPKYVDGGRTKSCGCLVTLLASRRTNYKDYSHSVVNETVQVVSEAGRTNDGLIVWSAVCLKCGNPFQITSAAIRKGVFSCGCYSRKMTRVRAINKILTLKEEEV